ncbi:helix-turn-helix transcriptional regulator [Lactobacillus sp. PV037]|uniref:helix-turn-helix domain-containing protein n=1 Tax=unclassified Lactobacillus TaxID=2620435 RepID=UPI0022400DC5|nr:MULTISPECIES: helix-turn-helix transcriptional regulator [unclassified Lactobacillus]QNQ82389.1 helix-turn-helix transcriptional regulator [Lactobacillus sp. PV012]QNQ83497.1 helix-turn-helix transcriptional regulator [Lactobacillus sp. PV037]
MDIGQRLKQFRILLGCKQEEFVKGIMSESYYSKIERGIGEIRITALIAILNKNRISLQDFFGEV